MSDREIIESMDYAKIFNELKKDVRASQLRAMRSVNTELIMLYHRIGTYILNLQKTQGWGSKVIDQLSKDLKSTFPEMKGFSVRNLKYMRKFAVEYPDIEKVQEILAQISWYHNLTLLDKIDNKEIRIFYAKQSAENKWSRDVMVKKIEQNYHNSIGKAVNNFKEKLPDNISERANQVLKDPYIFDFLNLHDEAVERELENGLIKHIEKFLLELGAGFAFVGRQYKITVGEKDYYLDLLFYHLKLRAYVVIELKTREFKPEYAGKLSFYLAAVDDIIKLETDNPTIGLIICKTKDNITAEYALKHINAPIGLAEYKLGEAIPKDLKTALPSIEDIEANLKRSLLQDKEELSTEGVDKLDEKGRDEEN